MSATIRTTARAVPAACGIAQLLRSAWPEHTAKRAARAAGVPHRTAEDWVQGRREPRARHLLEAAARDRALLAALRAQLDAMHEGEGSRAMDAGKLRAARDQLIQRRDALRAALQRPGVPDAAVARTLRHVEAELAQADAFLARKPDVAALLRRGRAA